MDSPPSKSLNTESEKTSPIESNTILTEDAFCNERSQKLFEAIDELQSCGANRDIDLPEVSHHDPLPLTLYQWLMDQLVIVGDQSAGKSSLLQSLTDIPFPVAGRLCTRFPTRIVSRRTPGESDVTRISIEAAFSGPFSQSPLEERQQRYAMFTQTSSNFTAAEFLTVVEKVCSRLPIKIAYTKWCFRRQSSWALLTAHRPSRATAAVTSTIKQNISRTISSGLKYQAPTDLTSASLICQGSFSL